MSCRQCPAHGHWYCDTCADRAARSGLVVPREPQRRPLTLEPDAPEAALQDAVQTLCHDAGILYWHARKSQGSTPGMPDCLICHPDRPGPLYTWELKREGEEPKPAQRRWLDALGRVTAIRTGVYTPRDLPTIATLLTDWR